MQLWKQFEDRIMKESWARNIFVSQIPTGCRPIFSGGRRRLRLVMVKTDFDFCAGCQGLAVFFDAKAQGKRTFNFRTHVNRDKTLHQYRKLLAANSMNNAAGYLIWFYELKKIVWAPISVVYELEQAGVKSLTPDTPGVRSQDDFIVIDLTKLVFGKEGA